MSRPGTALIGVFALLVLFVGCGEAERRRRPPVDEPDAGPVCDAPGPTVVDVEKFGANLYAALCSSMVRCDLFGSFQSVDECVAYYDRYSDGTQTKYLRRIKEALAHQLTTLDEAAMTRCLAELSTGACPVSLETPSCKAMLRGARDAGATCFTNEECAIAGSTCVGLDAEQACQAGVCSSGAALGQACSEAVPCAPDDHCVSRAGGAVCETGDAGARCGDSGDCDRALWCERGACVADRAIGATCRTDAECPGGSLCVGEMSSQGNTGVCSRVSVAGDVCDDYCFGALYCAVEQPGQNGACRGLPKQGESCFDSLGRCAGIGLTCNNDALCEPLPDLGQDCTAFCKAGLFCSAELGASEGTCLVLGASGAACARDGNCASYHCGADGKCQDWQACRGEAPALPDPCAAGR